MLKGPLYDLIPVRFRGTIKTVGNAFQGPKTLYSSGLELEINVYGLGPQSRYQLIVTSD